MKNPFEKNHNTGLIAGAVIGAVAAAAAVYLLLTDDGAETLTSIKHKAQDAVKDLASGIVSDKTGISKQTVKGAADVLVK